MVYKRTVVGTLFQTLYWRCSSEHWYPLALGRSQLMVGDLFLALSKQLKKNLEWTQVMHGPK